MKKVACVLVVLALLAVAASAMAASTTPVHKSAPRLAGHIVKVVKTGNTVKGFNLKVPCLNGQAKIVKVAVDADTKYLEGLRQPATVDAIAVGARAVVMFKEKAGEGPAVSVWINPEHPRALRTVPK